MTMSIVVVGAGISGLAAARRVRELSPEINLTVLDAAPRVGGMVETEHWKGLTIDHGPEGFVTTKPEALDLVDELGMTEEVVVDGPAPRQTFIVRDRQLRPLPYGILNPTRTAAKNLLRTPLISVSGKLRLAVEPLVRRKRDSSDESVADFVRRRFGSQMLEALVDPLIGGIHGGSTEDLSAEMLLPALRRHELGGRSVALAALRQKSTKRQLPPLVTLKRGMASLTDRMADDLGDSIELGLRVESIDRDGQTWLVRLDDGSVRRADGLILAIPASAAGALMAPHDAGLSEAVSRLPSSDSQTVTLIWEAGVAAQPESGTGFIVPRDEQRNVAACTWTTAKWHHRAEDGSVMIRCFVRAPGAGTDELVALARAEVAPLTGLLAEPSRVIVREVTDALPVMRIGHRDAVAEIHLRAGSVGGLALAGAGLEGSGLPACIRSGRRAAETILGDRVLREA